MAEIVFNGKVYGSISGMIQENTLEVRALYDHTKEKHRLEYRVYDGDTFTTITKYQAKRFLTKDQVIMIEAFESVKPLYYSSDSFMDRIVAKHMVRADEETYGPLYTMCQWMKERHGFIFQR